MILNEGGNIFKDPETKEPVTQRINQADVDPTLAWLEKITGLPHKDFKLGSREFWEISKDLHSDDEEDVYDPNSNTKRQGPKINVKKNRW